MNTTATESQSYYDLMLALINDYIKDVHKTSIAPTSEVIDLLLDIRNLASVWDSESQAPTVD